MEEYIQKYAKNSIVVSILLILLSMFLIFKPVQSLNLIMIALGVIVIFYGLIHAVSYFSAPKEYKIFSFELVQGVLFIVLGMVIVLNPSLINSFLTYILGAWIMIQSIIKIQLAFNIKTAESRNWIWMLILAVVSFLLGIVVIINPFATIATITTICGIILFVSEIMNIIEAIFVMKI